MMDFSERSANVGANVKPEIKYSLQEYIKTQREQGNSISMSRWIEEAIEEKLCRDQIEIIKLDEDYVGEDLPFEETL